MQIFGRRHYLSPVLLVLVHFTVFTSSKSHHIRHHRDRFKRQQGEHLYLPGSYVTDSDEPDRGPWMEWSTPSRCSRTCGGGVSTQYRECTPGYACTGSSRMHFSCNTQDCPDLADFRSQQCSEYDPISLNGFTYEWVPYTKGPNPCALNCKPRGDKFYYTFKVQVIDGTPCSDDTQDVCVDGKCQPVGCDMMLGSNAREDKCRVCDGDGSTCNTISGTFNAKNLQSGYNDILLIPRGAVNIRVREVKPSNNYLAIRNTTGYYHLNGNWMIDFPRTLEFAGCRFHYGRYPQGLTAPDTISCIGPTDESLFIVLLRQEPNVGVDYEYSVPKSVQQSTDIETYAWTFDQFTPCPTSCGGGYQHRNVSCAGRKSLEPADPKLCDPNNRPVESQRCGEVPCAAQWVAKAWEECSAPCGDGGVQTRQILCEQVISNGVPTVVDDRQCANVQKPPTQQPCNQGVVCALWHADPWKPCDRLCGKGKERRKVICYRKTKGVIEALDDSECAHEEKPESEKSCLLRPCEGVDWVASEWSGCENKCGLSEETRRVQCATAKGDTYPDSLCEEQEQRPAVVRKCESQAAGCEHEWFASQWSECSAKCGSGVQTRKVFCATVTDDGFKKVGDDKCDKSKKYDATKNCTAEQEECPGEWFSGPWSKCSKECGSGVKSRKVICMRDNITVPATDCDPDVLPLGSEVCNKQACDKDEVIPVVVTQPVDVAEPEAELITDDYEIVEDDECEDGEWIYDDYLDKPGPSKEKLIDLVLLPQSTTTGGRHTDITLELDDLMMSDTTYSDSSTFDLSTVEGSGDELTKTTSVFEGTLTTDEGSGDTEFGETEGGSTTESTGGATGTSTEATEVFVSSRAYTVGTDVTATATTGASEEATTATDLSEGTSTETETSGTTVDVSETTVGSAATDASQTTTGSAATDASQTTTGSAATDASQTTTGSAATDASQTTAGSVATDASETTAGSAATDASEGTTLGATTPSSDATDMSTGSTLEESTVSASSDTTTVGLTESQTTGETSTETTPQETTVELSTETTATETTPETSTDTTETPTDATADLSTESTDTSTTDSATTLASSAPVTAQTTSQTTEEPLNIVESDVESDEDETSTESTVTTERVESTEAATETSTDFTGSTTQSATESTESSATTGGTTSEATGSTEPTTEVAASSETSDASETTRATETSGLSEATGETTTETAGSTEPSGTTESATELTGTTESATEITGTTESATKFTGITASPTEITGTTESATEFTGTTESATEFTGTTESATKFTGTTETVTELTASTSSETEYDIWSSTTEAPVTKWKEIFESKPRKCRRKKKPNCKSTEYGCCSDKTTPAEGPFDKGCPMPKTCKETKYGCCEDGVSSAEGPEFKGCPPSDCEQTLFGCCPDKKTPAEGNNEKGCPLPPPACLKSEYGCCKDNTTAAQGPDEEGCEKEEELSSTEATTTTTEREDCSNTTYGCCPDKVTTAQGAYFKGCDIFEEDCNESFFKCCPDGKTSAEGPNYMGCKTECSTNPFGCCEDGITTAHGYNKEGCCLSTQFGCCPDNIKPADGPALEGCGCQYSTFGCCPDNATVARGYNYEGCGCQYTQHGCCPDSYTPAAGPDYAGCLCHTFQFGCCPDGVSVARGPHQQGCGCRNTEFGCCSDDETPASGPNFEGCGCASSKYGCCIDGTTEAQGENFGGCLDIPENLQASCSLLKERGTCRNYTVKWFYDVEYGGCSRFWYGGCDGNGNRFRSKDECVNICVEPQGKDVCNLPQISGPCEGYYPMWSYDKDQNHCRQFIYGGCLGNNNRFETFEQCSSSCVRDLNIDACDQPKEEGPCRGTYRRWYYDDPTSTCQQFIYGGCKGNNNNFPTETSCKQKCAQPGRKKEHCSLPRAQGNCTERLPRWYYDATERRCMPFYYSGCEGNNNNFISEHHCEDDCPQDVVKDTCHLAADIGGCSNYTERWYYDTREKVCRQFYYGGCDGNGNNFVTQQACQQRCEQGLVVTEPPAPSPDYTPAPSPSVEVEEPFRTEFCLLPNVTGPCRSSLARWFYDRDGVCKQFVYGGCEGNRNNFPTAEECRHFCANSQDICTLPKVVGPCDAEYQQWYYNETTDTCELFTYGGCLGNDNRFEDQLSCEQKCRRGPPSVTQGPPLGYTQLETDVSICYKPVTPGNCNDSIPAYYYDPHSQKCAAFVYTGCGGNANRYNSQEQCERQCGRFRGQDVCNLPKDPGPCRGYFIKTYFDTTLQRCAQFVYGGCDGNGNRFSSEEECNSICISRAEPRPSMTNREICRLPVDVGPCQAGAHKRWYYDDERGECIAFIYSGCGGNFNSFTSFQACEYTCKEYMKPVEFEENEINETETEHPCQKYVDECVSLRCPYGVEAFVDSETLCNECKCHNPCGGYDCPEDSQCAIDLNRNVTSPEDHNYVAVCRKVKKPGHCPPPQSNEQCAQECSNDADCAFDLKCCPTACGTSCAVPASSSEGPPVPLMTTSYLPAYTESPVQKGYYPPEVIQDEFEPTVSAREGEYAVLRCAVKGNPTPNITWSKGDILIDGREPRYRLLLNGILQIIALYKTDSGTYICTADNKIGQPLRKEIQLEVQDPQEQPAKIMDVEVPTIVVVSLGSPTTLNCYAYGWPRPAITWWKDKSMVPLKTSEFTIYQNHSLVLHSVRLHNLGEYKCQAYTGFGRAASWSVTVKALGPIFSTNPNDQKYMEHVVDAPERPTAAPRPQYPYRPTRVTRPAPPRPRPYRPTPRSVFIDPPWVTSPTTEVTIAPEVDSRPVYSVPVKANISLQNYKYPVGSDVNIPCDVDGYPIPEVQWYKDGQPLSPGGNIVITDSHRLFIHGANLSDSGEYRCEAWNQFSRATSTTPLLIDGMIIHPNCTDNRFFANCKLIVQGDFCMHKYYARFCCRSCTEAGLLSSNWPSPLAQDKQAALQGNIV